MAAERITFICIGEHLGIARFGGLGELRPEQLEALPAAAAVTLTEDALDLAARAWAALRAPDPRGLAEVVAARSPELRFLPEAFDRLGREYPWTRDGLSLTERRLLAAVAEGAATAGEAFVRGAAREARPYLGDTWAFAAIERLARCAVPLLDAGAGVGRSPHAAGPDRRRPRVLDGAADHVALSGVDRWVGGVHPGGARGGVAVGRRGRGGRGVLVARRRRRPRRPRRRPPRTHRRRRSTQSSSSTQSIARVTALRHLR